MARTRAGVGPTVPSRDLLVSGQGAVGERAGDDGAAPPGREDTVDPQARPLAVGGGRRAPGQCGQLGPEPFEAGRQAAIDTSEARRRSHRHHRGAGQERAGHPLGHLQHRQLDEVGVVEHVDLGHGDHAMADADELEDPQVLFALGLPALGPGHDEQAGVDAADAGQHVAQEPHVTRDVDEG